jgi:hypothetical protein
LGIWPDGGVVCDAPGALEATVPAAVAPIMVRRVISGPESIIVPVNGSFLTGYRELRSGLPGAGRKPRHARSKTVKPHSILNANQNLAGVIVKNVRFFQCGTAEAVAFFDADGRSSVRFLPTKFEHALKNAAWKFKIYRFGKMEVQNASIFTAPVRSS